MRTTSDAARLIDTHFKTGLKNGILIGVPIPQKYSIDSQYIENVIKEALENAKRLNIQGKAITPYLLENINKLTKGKSLESNIELIKNNAKIGAEVAKKLVELNGRKSSLVDNSTSVTETTNHQITLIGGVNIDFAFKLNDNKTMQYKGVTQPCTFHQCLGGVARNMAESLIRFGVKRSYLISAISNDLIGNYITDKSKSIGFDTSKWLVLDNNKEASTGSYCTLFDPHGELLFGLGAMKAHDYIAPKFVEKHEELLHQSSICIVDADLPVETLHFVVNKCYNLNLPVWFNPTDLRKCMRIIQAKTLSKVTYMSPNTKELLTIFTHVFERYKECDSRVGENEIKKRLTSSELIRLEEIKNIYKNNMDHIEINDLKMILKYLVIYVPFIFLSQGSKDLILASSRKLNLNERKQLPIKNTKASNLCEWSPEINYFPVVKLKSNEVIINESGAGDNTSAGIIAGIMKDYDLISTIYSGLLAAKYTILTHENVANEVSSINLNILNSIVEEYRCNIKTENL